MPDSATPKEIAAKLRCTLKTVYEHCRRGHWEAWQPVDGGAWRIEVDDRGRPLRSKQKR